MGHLSKAIEHEENGEFESAATQYMLKAIEIFEDSDYESGFGIRRGTAMILNAMSSDARGGRNSRVRNRFHTFEPLFDRFENEAEDVVLLGLAHEWIGDAYLLIGDGESLERYQQAKTCFTDLDIDSQMFWGAQPEYDYEFGAMSEFFEHHNIEYFADHSLDFEGRVQFKLDAIEEHSLL